MKFKSLLAACCMLVVQFRSISAETFSCPSLGRFPDPDSVDCRSFYYCASATDVGSLTRCPGTTLFDPSMQKCVVATAYTCPDPVTTTTEVPTSEVTTTESSNGFICPSEGRHPNPESDCKTYYLCSEVDGNLVAYLMTCPGSNIFSWSSLNCVMASSYTCPNKVPSSTTESSTEPVTTAEPITTTPEPSTTPTTTQLLPTTLEPTFVCSSSGRFPNPDESDCQSYKYCLQASDSTFQEYTFRCPAGSNFNPTEARCTVGYVCAKALTTTTTTEPPTTTAATSSFVCQEEGRFADPESCNRYIFCTRSVDGSLVQHAFKCPPNSWFKPNESRCSATYVCN